MWDSWGVRSKFQRKLVYKLYGRSQFPCLQYYIIRLRSHDCCIVIYIEYVVRYQSQLWYQSLHFSETPQQDPLSNIFLQTKQAGELELHPKECYIRH